MTTVAYVKDQNLVTRVIGGETILVPIQNNVSDLSSIYTLNELGSFIWQLLDGQRGVGQIVGCVIRQYEVSSEQAQQDVAELLSALEKARLIKAQYNDSLAVQ